MVYQGPLQDQRWSRSCSRFLGLDLSQNAEPRHQKVPARLGVRAVINQQNTRRINSGVFVFWTARKNYTLKSLLELYRLDATQNGEPKSYERLLEMAQRHLEERRRKKNRDEYSQGGMQRSLSPVGDSIKGRGKTMEKGKGKGQRKKPSREKGDCHQWAEKRLP